jgi:hypothetical protein
MSVALSPCAGEYRNAPPSIFAGGRCSSRMCSH